MMNIYVEAAEKLGCTLSAIKAVALVESAGSGFLEDGRPKILFEAHIFSRLTGQKYDSLHPNISSKKWNKSLYVGGAFEHQRLADASVLKAEEAYKSASWGKFQIMGFNYKRCGFDNIQQFIFAMNDERGQLMAFVNFVISMKLADELQRRDWAGFASVYNGPAYAKNKYDWKMAQAYKKFSKEVGL
jgi:hypothetical protein